MASVELDPSIKQSLKFLHSSTRESAEQVRILLDEVIKQNCGNAKMMSNVLPKKYLIEDRNDGSQKSKHKSEKQSHAKISPVQSQSPQRLQILEKHDDDNANVIDGELAFDLLEEDLTCTVCRQIAVQAGNRLVECDSCHALYHQDCHKPAISDDDVSSEWQCALCLSTQGYSVGSYNSTKASPINVKTSPMRQPSTSSSVKVVTTVPATTSSSKVITPNINIISADKRLQIMKKKAAKQQEIKRKHVK